MSVFGKNGSRCLSNFLQSHIFWNFDHISGNGNQINYRDIWFTKVIIILTMTAQALFSMFLSKKTSTLMPLSNMIVILLQESATRNLKPNDTSEGKSVKLICFSILSLFVDTYIYIFLIFECKRLILIPGV